MIQNHLILVFIIELAIFYLVIYSINRANNWVNRKQEYIDEISVKISENLIKLRAELKNLNFKIEKYREPKPFSSSEFGMFCGEIFSELIFSKFKKIPFGKNFFILSIIIKLWKYRDRIKATLLKGIVLS